eukprot:GHVU01139577.1.p1 GENE.GHVU01139577.1~~GHVU01139577.1.p1  ORF type:complete len:135 (-),score=44.29 GHVU01139577.1:552-956(-)
MLSALVKESQAKQAKLKALNDSNRKEALAATESVANLMTDSVQESVNEVYAAQNKLEKEVKGLQTNTAHFAKQTYQWLEMIKSFNGSLKDCGDFQNWAKTVEWDMRNIASALDYVQRDDAAAAAGGFAPAQPAT